MYQNRTSCDFYSNGNGRLSRGARETIYLKVENREGFELDGVNTEAVCTIWSMETK
jgi:hypothetical protein